MHLIYFDESGQSGTNLADASQPIFVLAALVVPEHAWLAVEKGLQAEVEKHFHEPRPVRFEIHATALRNGDDFFRKFPVSHRLAFRDACLKLAQKHGLHLVYRAIAKRRFQHWIQGSFGSGVLVNPIESASSLVLQLCDLCAYSARKKEEAKAGLPLKPIDQGGIALIEPIIYRGNEAMPDTLDWVIATQKKERPGDKPGSV